MNRTVAYLAGPELVWILMLTLAGIIVALNQPVTDMGHIKLIWLNWSLPAIGVMLAFVPLFWALGSPWWWFVRITLSSLIGIVLLVGFLSKSASYQDIRDVAVGMTFVFYVGLGWAILTVMGLLFFFFLLANESFLPVLRWILILFTLVVVSLKLLWRLT
jgi:hypothetical protein